MKLKSSDIKKKKLVFEYEGDWANWFVYEIEPISGYGFWVEGGSQFLSTTLEDAVQGLKEDDFDQWHSEWLASTCPKDC